MRTLEEVPEGATHWSKRELARRAGISPTSVHRIWRAFSLQPWRTEDFKISPDPPERALDPGRYRRRVRRAPRRVRRLTRPGPSPLALMLMLSQ